MSPDLITSLFTGLTGLVAGLAAYTASRSRRVAMDQREMRRQVRHLQKQLIATVGHLFELEIRMASAGLQPPPRPPILEEYSDDDATDATPAPQRPTTTDGG